MNIGEIEDQLNIPQSTIRYYEKIGLLKEQPRVSGNRVFDNEALKSLKFIQLAQNAGFSNKETKLLLHSAADSPPSCDQWRFLALEKRTELRKKMAQLKKMDSILSRLAGCNCLTLNECIDRCFKG